MLGITAELWRKRCPEAADFILVFSGASKSSKHFKDINECSLCGRGVGLIPTVWADSPGQHGIILYIVSFLQLRGILSGLPGCHPAKGWHSWAGSLQVLGVRSLMWTECQENS